VAELILAELATLSLPVFDSEALYFGRVLAVVGLAGRLSLTARSATQLLVVSAKNIWAVFSSMMVVGDGPCRFIITFPGEASRLATACCKQFLAGEISGWARWLAAFFFPLPFTIIGRVSMLQV